VELQSKLFSFGKYMFILSIEVCVVLLAAVDVVVPTDYEEKTVTLSKCRVFGGEKHCEVE
jgi:hypothetical protein